MISSNKEIKMEKKLFNFWKNYSCPKLFVHLRRSNFLRGYPLLHCLWNKTHPFLELLYLIKTQIKQMEIRHWVFKKNGKFKRLLELFPLTFQNGEYFGTSQLKIKEKKKISVCCDTFDYHVYVLNPILGRWMVKACIY